jgi:hypothetical protein
MGLTAHRRFAGVYVRALLVLLHTPVRPLRMALTNDLGATVAVLLMAAVVGHLERWTTTVVLTISVSSSPARGLCPRCGDAATDRSRWSGSGTVPPGLAARGYLADGPLLASRDGCMHARRSATGCDDLDELEVGGFVTDLTTGSRARSVRSDDRRLAKRPGCDRASPHRSWSPPASRLLDRRSGAEAGSGPHARQLTAICPQ